MAARCAQTFECITLNRQTVGVWTPMASTCIAWLFASLVTVCIFAAGLCGRHPQDSDRYG